MPFAFETCTVPTQNARRTLFRLPKDKGRILGKRIGSSQMPTLLGLNPYSPPSNLMKELRGEAEPFEGNVATAFGNATEDFHRILLNSKLRLLTRTWKVNLRPEFCLVNMNIPWEVSTPDGHLDAPEDAIFGDTGIRARNCLVELKAVFTRRGQGFPLHYLAQVQRQMAVTRTMDHPKLKNVTHCILSVMEAPLDTSGPDKEEVIIQAGRPWVLKLFAVPFSEEFNAWAEGRFAQFIEAYNNGTELSYPEDQPPPRVSVVDLGQHETVTLGAEVRMWPKKTKGISLDHNTRTLIVTTLDASETKRKRDEPEEPPKNTKKAAIAE